MRRRSGLRLTLCACLFIQSAGLFEEGSAHAQTATSELLAEHQRLRDRVAAVLKPGGEFDDAHGALELAERALEIAEELYGTGDLELVADLEHLAFLQVVTGDTSSGRTSVERALRIQESRLGQAHPATLNTLNALGAILLQAGQLEDATAYFEAALQGLEQTVGARSRAVAQSLHLIGLALRKRGQYRLALPRFEQALAIFDDVLGEKHSDTLATRSELALVLDHLGDFEGSLAHYEATLAISEEVFGVDSSFARPLLSGLGGLHYDAGDYREAKHYYERALAVAERSEPSDESLILDHVTDLGTVLVRLGEQTEAEKVFLRILSIARDSPAGNSTAAILAILTSHGGDPSKALGLIDAVIADSERVYGPRSTVTGNYLSIRACLRRRLGSTGKALADAERAVDIGRELLGRENPALVNRLEVLADLLLDLGEAEAANKLLEEALTALQSRAATEHPQVERLVGRLDLARRETALEQAGAAPPRRRERYTEVAAEVRGEIDSLEGDRRFRDALPVAVRLLELSRRLGAGREAAAELASNLTRVGDLQRLLGDYEGALAHYKEAREVLAGSSQAGGTLLAEVLCGEVAVFLARGDSRPLEPSLRLALEAADRSPDLDSEQVKSLKARALSLLAMVHLQSGALEQALAEATKALGTKAESCGDQDWRCADERLLRGRVLREMGRPGAARSLVERALFSLQGELGEDHPATVRGHYELGMIHLDLGDFAPAGEHLRRALALRERAGAHRDLLLLDILDGLFLVALYRDELREAAHLAARMLDQCEAMLAPDHPRRALCLSNYGELLRARGELEAARSHLERAVAAFKDSVGLGHARASALLRLGLVHEEMGELRRAEHRYQSGHRSLIAALGPGHPATALSFKNLASFFEARGDAGKAIAMATSCLDAEEELLLASLGVGSDEERMRLLSDLGDSVDLAVSLNTRSFPGEDRALRLAVETVLRRKGRGLDSSWEYSRVSRADGSPLSDEARRDLTSLRSELSSILLHGRPDLHQRKRLEEIRRIEREIRWRSASLEEAAREALEDAAEIDLRRLQEAVPPKTALVELVVFRAYDRKEVTLRRYNRDLDSAEPRYIAYVIHRSGEPRWVDLGEKRVIDERVSAFRDALRLRRADIGKEARGLDSLTMARIRPLLGDVTQLVISPDGALNLVPFEALVDPEGRFLVEDFSVSYVSSGRDLLRSGDVETPAQGPPVVVGGADFDASFKERAGVGDAARATEMRPLRFASLPGTLEEARAIGELLRDGRVLTGAAATETALKDADSPTILHVATHGFFLQERDRPPPPRLEPTRFGRPALVGVTEDPMLRSGLALAGANRHDRARDANDGVLTALEVMDLDLWGTEVVVLSACETGVGEVRNGEGVFGLRRALVLAGARTQVMSLWQVADEATKDLMISWYQQILDGVPRAEAMRRAQLAALRGEPLPGTDQVLRGGDQVLRGGRRVQLSDDRAARELTGTRHPFYWASFIVSGEPGPLSIRGITLAY